MKGLSEFDLIRDHFAPLARTNPGALGLGDDVAILAGTDIIVTKDQMIAGVHFLADDPLDLVAQKLLRVNVSDLTAKGVRAEGYLLACAWPADIKDVDIAAFARGLERDQRRYSCVLYGGDTTRHTDHSAPLTLSATFFGRRTGRDPHDIGIVPRDEAGQGEDVYVTGTIGDAGLGLMVCQGHYQPDTEDRDFLVGRYRLPEPRVTFGSALATFASAALDVSDGLIADAGHIAQRSRVDIEILLGDLPVSAPAAQWVSDQDDEDKARHELACSGDDYEILFTAPTGLRRSVEMAAKASKTQVTRVGRTFLPVGEDGAVRVRGHRGDLVAAGAGGFRHF